MPPIVFVIVSILIVLVLIYLAFFRSWQLRWGGTDDEVNRSLQGDDIVREPSFNATRAVTIHASAENIYPWIVQMDVTRAGWYSYDLLDNLGRPTQCRKYPDRTSSHTGGRCDPHEPGWEAGNAG